MNGWGGRDVGRLGDWGSKRVVWFGLGDGVGWGIRRRGRVGFLLLVVGLVVEVCWLLGSMWLWRSYARRSGLYIMVRTFVCC